MEIKELLNLDKNLLSKSDLAIINYLLKNEEEILYVTSKDISEKLGVSPTTLSRFWRKIGFTNIKDFKQNINLSSSITPASKVKSTIDKLKNSPIQDIMLKNISNINKTMGSMDENKINECINLILNRQKIYVYAPDASFGIAKVFEYRLKRFGINLIFIGNGSSLFEDLINIKEDDLVIIFSYSKILSEVHVLLEQSRIVPYDTIVFTDLISSKLNDYSALILYSYRGESTEYHSMVSSLSLLDCIILELAMKKSNSINNIESLNKVRANYSNYLKR